MSTRSYIGAKNPDGTITAVYCHFDGYPEGVGKTLKEHYVDSRTVARLLSGGDMSALGSNVDKTDFYSEPDSSARTYHDDKAFMNAATRASANYAYLMVDGQWETRQLY